MGDMGDYHRVSHYNYRGKTITCALYVDDGQKKGSDINQEGFTISSFPLHILRLLESNKNILMN